MNKAAVDYITHNIPVEKVYIYLLIDPIEIPAQIHGSVN